MSEFNKFKKRAEKLFANRDYEQALFNYSIALKNAPQDSEARLGAILSDLAMDSEEEAQALFDYYSVIKGENPSEAVRVIEEIIESLDGGLDTLSQLLSDTLTQKVDSINGINYSDFKQLLDEGNSFTELFESIMFSTKVIISNKHDFFEFMEMLIEHGFKEMALNYIESTSSAYAHEPRFHEILEKLEN
jgi:tetratricopeptide (TPR) repeat protein